MRKAAARGRMRQRDRAWKLKQHTGQPVLAEDQAAEPRRNLALNVIVI